MWVLYLVARVVATPPEVVTSPVRFVTADACEPAPATSWPEVREAAEVTQVAQAIVPVPVIVPPVIGEVVATEVTVPLAAAPPSVNVQVVPELVQVTMWPVVGTTVNPLIVFVVVAALPQIV